MLLKLLLLFSLYLPFQVALNPSAGVDLASVRIFALILGILWLIMGFKNKRIFIPNKIQTLLTLSFLFFNSLSLIFAQNLDWGLRKLLFLFSFFPLYFVVADLAQNKDAKNKIVKWLVYGAGAIGLVGIIQFALQFIVGLDPTLNLWRKIIVPFLGYSFSGSVIQNSSWLVNIGGRNYFRAVAFFPDPHILSFYLGMILPFSVVLAFQKSNYSNMPNFAYAKNSSNANHNNKGTGPFDKKINYKFLLISCFIFIADLLTFSRGGYVGLAAGIIFTLFLARTMVRYHWKLYSSLALIFILAILVISPMRERFISSFNFSEGSNTARFETWQQSLNVIVNNPLGVGIGNYALEIKPSADYREPIYSHNLYMDITAETGVINMLIWLVLIIASVLVFVRNPRNNLLSSAGAVSLIIFSAHSIFETALFSVQILPLLIILIALSATGNES